ncbi:MAG: UDP-N-acetylmuramoyl-tripeptide--D-alanyl-D-alanine ligase [Bacteroidales bacterium]|nr:UDP-N-acetylmuramoyl-tripeptide--D-alanyl-D-alanine ligase [Bacteroidales bacterium]
MRIGELYKKYRECGGRVSTDSRTVEGGEMFFALRGDNFDGNQFALNALRAGARYVVMSRNASGAYSRIRREDRRNGLRRSQIIFVKDPLKALQNLATHHRKECFFKGEPLKVIALTGTNGKTTTKDLIREVLAVKYNVAATVGNLNNGIGVPLTLLKIGFDTQIAVVEMGASHFGDIEELTSIALPDYGLVTNVGKGHLEYFGGLEGVMKAKGELYDYILKDGEKVFVNADNLLLQQMVASRPGLKIVRYGTQFSVASVLPSSPEHPYLRLEFPGGRVLNTKLAGAYNADNVMAAVAVGKEFGVDENEAFAAIQKYEPSNSRSQVVRTESNTLLVDDYNANPTSMDAALSTLEAVGAALPKAAMLGNMLELGEDSVKEHVRVLKKLSKMQNLDTVVLVGEEFRKALTDYGDEGGFAESVHWFGTSEEASDWLKENPVRKCVVLIKGSRGSKMENVVDVL